MLKKLLFVLMCFSVMFVSQAEASSKVVKLLINNQEAPVEPGAMLSEGQVYVPLRFVAEQLGVQVQWDEQETTVNIKQLQGDNFLNGKNHNTGDSPSIMNNLIKARDLRDILDDDNDRMLADYREGHNGGDNKANDPLVIDLRKKEDYDEAHIPGAVWVAPSKNIAEIENVLKIKKLLAKHVASGGKNEIVLYCYTGNTSGLATGVLGVQGLPVRNMMYGFDIAWRGTKYVDRPIKADMEDSNGAIKKCGG
ncbi:MAG: sulfurtransferase [Firmicutes bacterium]|nr:sulfurtransferase [Bacillota bacterium]